MLNRSNDPQLKRLLSDARLRLIETGTRNRLIHTNRRSKRSSAIAVSFQSVDALLTRLLVDSASLRFRSDPRAPAERDPSGADDAAPKLIGGSGDWLQTTVAEETLQKRLLKLYREAKTLEEEQGVNILYLAIGFLRWYEDEKSAVIREAPLILLPVQLIRDVKRSTFDLRLRDDDINANLPLSERLKDDFGITLPSLPEEESWHPTDYFDRVEEAIAGRERWAIDRSGIELGFFSFAKLLMFHDLDPKGGAENLILNHPLLRGLLVDGFSEEHALFEDDVRLDEIFAPENLVHVVDADGSQALAIETVRGGRNLVIQGPPGTGKSQTIANLIASSVNDGKTVLFVAEKMVALEVVHSRLEKVKLGPICLQLHSRSTNKRALAEELGRTLLAGAAVPRVIDNVEKLRITRDSLSAISNELHRPIALTGMTAYRVIGELVQAVGKHLPPPQTRLPEASNWTAQHYKDLEKSLSRFVENQTRVGSRAEHPWGGVLNVGLQPTELTRVCIEARSISDRLTDLLEHCDDAMQSLAFPAVSDFAGVEQVVGVLEVVGQLASLQTILVRKLSSLSDADLRKIRSIVAACINAKNAIKLIDQDFLPSSLTVNTASLRNGIFPATISFWAKFSVAYRRSSIEFAGILKKRLPKKATERLALLDRLSEIQEFKKVFQNSEAQFSILLGDEWQGEHTDFTALDEAARWLEKANPMGLVSRLEQALTFTTGPQIDQLKLKQISTHQKQLQDDIFALLRRLEWESFPCDGASNLGTISLRVLLLRLRAIATEMGRYNEWAELLLTEQDTRKIDSAGFVNRILSGQLFPQLAVEELRYARAEALWEYARANSVNLGRAVYQGARSELVREFVSLEHARRAQVAAIVLASHAERMPPGAVGEMGIIRGEIARKRGHMAIRKLIGSAGRTIQKIKPVFMMSPISVAQFLPLGAVEFDLVVIDEASQVRPEDALGLIARGKQIVVVGDRKQLPPTSFFSRLLSDDETSDEEEIDGQTIAVGGAKATDLESILTLCEARGVASKMLRWHYRSRHPSLIEVSNAEFYQSNLFMPPSPISRNSSEGLQVHKVNGSYDRGGKRTNVIEAQAIVDAVAIHARDFPERSLGIVTFSTAQRDIISNLLDESRRHQPEVDMFMGKPGEEVFVKNLENVQGDERDVILVSVGYGPRIAGTRLDSMSFGPVSGEGGERRLNVLFTRARYQCEIFVSFESSDIDLARASGEGPRVLKRFLAFAETGVLEQPLATGKDFDSPFEEDVAQTIRSLGYDADPQVGSAGFRIDLGVKDPDAPGRYILAVECDGATYHSALWARQRDRLRQEVLEGLGWCFHRIWSTDWFYRRDDEIARLRTVLDEAKSLTENKPLVVPPFVAPEPARVFVTQPASSVIPFYCLTKLDITLSGEPHEIAVSQMAPIVRAIVEQEGPAHQAEIARRVASIFGKERTGVRILQAAIAGLRHNQTLGIAIQQSEEFWFTKNQAENCPIRDRSGGPPSLLKADMLPPLEIRAATKQMVRDNGAIKIDEAPAAVARLFGYQRTGPDIRDKIRLIINDMITDKSMTCVGDMLRMG